MDPNIKRWTEREKSWGETGRENESEPRNACQHGNVSAEPGWVHCGVRCSLMWLRRILNTNSHHRLQAHEMKTLQYIKTWKTKCTHRIMMVASSITSNSERGGTSRGQTQGRWTAADNSHTLHGLLLPQESWWKYLINDARRRAQMICWFGWLSGLNLFARENWFLDTNKDICCALIFACTFSSAAHRLWLLSVCSCSERSYFERAAAIKPSLMDKLI